MQGQNHTIPRRSDLTESAAARGALVARGSGGLHDDEGVRVRFQIERVDGTLYVLERERGEVGAADPEAIALDEATARLSAMLDCIKISYIGYLSH